MNAKGHKKGSSSPLLLDVGEGGGASPNFL